MISKFLSHKIVFIFVLFWSFGGLSSGGSLSGESISNKSISDPRFPAPYLAVTSLINDAYQQIGLNQQIDLKNGVGSPTQTQTLAYLSNHDLYENLNSNFSRSINELGISFFKELFKDIIGKEIQYKDDYYVFYHGQTREFALPQDIYQGLYNIVYKKILNDFVMLRFPDKDFSKFGSIKDFLKKYVDNGELLNRMVWFDTQPHTKNHLLSVNSSLFGNTYLALYGESTFHYFINSISATTVDIVGLVANVFNIFKMDKYFEAYKELINELNDLLGCYEREKTGLLLQIFVPKKLINEIAYRCRSGGYLYYDDQSYHPASKDLEEYNDHDCISFKSGRLLDTMQFRLLMDNFDHEDGAKIFRYCKETQKFNEYKTKLKELLDKIEQGDI